MNKYIATALVIGMAVPTFLLAAPGVGGNRFLQRFDANNDGKVTQEEINTVKSEQFAKYDKDGNGVLSLEEWQAMRQDRMKERQAQGFSRHDANGDGGISKEEFLAKSNRWMERMDHNGDHMIDQDEMGQHHGYGHRGHHGHGYGPGGGNCANS